MFIITFLLSPSSLITDGVKYSINIRSSFFGFVYYSVSCNLGWSQTRLRSKNDLEFVILLPTPAKGWDYRPVLHARPDVTTAGTGFY